MTKQELREGLADIFSTLEGGIGGAEYSLADEVLKYLDSVGVVLKVDRELPENLTVYYRQSYIFKTDFIRGKRALDRLGYKATESLIEVKENGL